MHDPRPLDDESQRKQHLRLGLPAGWSFIDADGAPCDVFVASWSHARAIAESRPSLAFTIEESRDGINWVSTPLTHGGRHG
ncbi:MAG: hypothetical protein K8T90_18675 [Planctomycetes bacterium]|nr:hypothetical protein [Planctomycetota bacterium]